jgi:hypothetical protein
MRCPILLPMVPIIRCDRDEADLRDSSKQVAIRRGHEWTLELKLTRRQKIWTHPGAHLTILIDKLSGTDYITNLGWTAKRKRSEELNQVLEISRIESLATPVQYGDAEDLIPERLKSHLVYEGTLPSGTGMALVDALVQIRPDLRHAIERIEAASRQYQINDSIAGQILAMQRDASVGAVRMAGMDGSEFARWDRPAVPLADEVIAPNFTDGAPGARNGQEPRALEDRQIDHDARTMIGWLAASAPHVSWCRFTGFGQRLYVANANRDVPENTLGTDLIYFNATRQSLVLVQYKRMDPRKGNYYYPDSDDGLAAELERMEKVDTLVAASASEDRDFRLDPAPSWLKVCQSQAFIPQTADMVMGMYFTREHFGRLRKDPRCQGPQGGTRFGFKNTPHYLDNTMFHRLVETGLIGTTGTSTQVLYDQIMLSFEGHKSLVVATLQGKDMPQSQRNSEKRELRTRGRTKA